MREELKASAAGYAQATSPTTTKQPCSCMFQNVYRRIRAIGGCNLILDACTRQLQPPSTGHVSAGEENAQADQGNDDTGSGGPACKRCTPCISRFCHHSTCLSSSSRGMNTQKSTQLRRDTHAYAITISHAHVRSRRSRGRAKKTLGHNFLTQSLFGRMFDPPTSGKVSVRIRM